MTDVELQAQLAEVLLGRWERNALGPIRNDEVALNLATEYAEAFVPTVRGYANDFAAMKLREAAADVDVCCERVVARRAEAFDHLLTKEN